MVDAPLTLGRFFDLAVTVAHSPSMSVSSSFSHPSSDWPAPPLVALTGSPDVSSSPPARLILPNPFFALTTFSLTHLLTIPFPFAFSFSLPVARL